MASFSFKKLFANRIWWHYTLIPIGLAITTILFYLPSLHYDFQFDDIANITKHFNIRHHTFQELFFSGSRWISYWLNAFYYSISKFNPFPYRIGNLVIHTTNGILVFFIALLALTGLPLTSWFKKNAFFISLLTSILFLLHPVQTQTVSYVIQGELEGMAALSIFSMVLCLILFVRSTSIIAKMVLVLVLSSLAALSTGTKEIAIISPVLLIIIDWFFLSQGTFFNHHTKSKTASQEKSAHASSLFSRAWLYAILSSIVIGCYLYFLKPAFFIEIFGLQKVVKNNIGNVISHGPDNLIHPWDFFISQFKVIVHYLWMFIWPFNISVEYDWVLCRGLFSPDCLFPLLVLIAIAYLIFKLMRKNPADPIAFGLVWFFACIAPRSSIIPSPELLVDYKTYTASFGWLFVLACGLVALANYLVTHINKNFGINQSFSAGGYFLFTLLLTLLLGCCTLSRNTVWRSGLEFWDNMIQNAPKKARTYNNYGVELSLKLGKYKEAIPYFKKAIAMDANYPDPCNNLAVAYASMHMIDEAIDAMKSGLRINPYYPEGYNNLAHMFIQKKEYAMAEHALKTALQMRPYYGKAYYNMARIRLENNQPEEAWALLKKACTEADLDTESGFSTFAKVSFDLKKYDDAIWGYTKALELNPNFTEAEFNLANTYFMATRYADAEQHYKHLLTITPQDYRVHFNLGETYTALGNYSLAMNYYTQVPKNHPALPAIGLRMANCCDKMGNHEQACALLQEVVATPNMPEQLKDIARTVLAGRFGKKSQA